MKIHNRNTEAAAKWLEHCITTLFSHVDVGAVVPKHGPVSLSGSISLVRRGDKYFGISTFHQFKDTDTSTVGIGLTNRSMGAATSSEARRIVHPHFVNSAISDLVFFDFTSAVQSGYIEPGRFFSIDTARGVFPNLNQCIFGLHVLGYPAENVSVTYRPNGEEWEWEKFEGKRFLARTFPILT